MERTWIHQTNERNLNMILNDGFKIDFESLPGRFGHGIYLMSSLDFGRFGSKTIYVKLNQKPYSITHSEICSIWSHLNLQPEEEGLVELKDYILNKGYNSVEIMYSDGTSELVVYNTDVIDNIWM